MKVHSDVSDAGKNAQKSKIRKLTTIKGRINQYQLTRLYGNVCLQWSDCYRDILLGELHVPAPRCSGWSRLSYVISVTKTRRMI
jgi:hypothetical protein